MVAAALLESASVQHERFQVAITYANDNKALAESLYETLKSNKIRVFYDRAYQTHAVGQGLADLLDHVYCHSCFIVILASDTYFKHDWSKYEFINIKNHRGLKANHGVIIIKTEKNDLQSDELNNVVFLDYHIDCEGDLSQAASVVIHRVKQFELRLKSFTGSLCRLPISEQLNIDEIEYGEGTRIIRIPRSDHLVLPKESVLPPGRGSLKEMLDAQRLISDEKLHTPRIIRLKGRRTEKGTTVSAFRFTDTWYPQNYETSYHDCEFSIACKQGQGGIKEFVDAKGNKKENSPFFAENGLGTVGANCVVESYEGEPIHRSQFVITVRKGIRYPDDVWLSQRTGKPFTWHTGDLLRERFIFTSWMPNGDSTDIFAACYDGTGMRNLTAKEEVASEGFYHDGEEVARWESPNRIIYASNKGGEPIKTMDIPFWECPARDE